MALSVWVRSLRLASAAPRRIAARSVPLVQYGLLSSSLRSMTTSNAMQTLENRREGSHDYSALHPAPAPAASPAEDEPKKASKSLEFSSLKDHVSHDTLKAITVKPYTLKTMTPVQAEVLPLLPELVEPHSPDRQSKVPRDLLVKAKTGTGKTLAFLIPAIEKRLAELERAGKKAVVDAGLSRDRTLETQARRTFARSNVGALILSPTRELATQIAKEAIRLTSHHKDFEVQLFVGGESKSRQIRDWTRGRRDIVVATTGRLRDLLESEPSVAEGLANTELFILDEADTMLDLGFREDISAISEFLPPSPRRQTFMFSATVSRPIQQVAQTILSRDHKFINTVTEEESPVHAHVPQYHTVLPSAAEQVPYLLKLIAHDQLQSPRQSKVVVFMPTTKTTALFASILRDAKDCLPAGHRTTVYELHSKKDQRARSRTSDLFRGDKTGCSILVTSDVSARGVDYPGVSRVIQVGVPDSPEQYVHRVGRTGRAGMKGRGDLVLLPFENSYPSWQLSHIPIKPVTISEIQTQLKDLAEKHDENPREFFSHAPKDKVFDPKSRRTFPPATFSSSVCDVMANLEPGARNAIEYADQELIKESYASMLGYYIAKAQDLRTQRLAVLQALKDWSTEAMGLSTPPYTSAMFLQKLGINEESKKRNPSGRWMGDSHRPRERSREGRNSRFERTRSDANDDESTDWSRSKDFRPKRYGQRRY